MAEVCVLCCTIGKAASIVGAATLTANVCASGLCDLLGKPLKVAAGAKWKAPTPHAEVAHCVEMLGADGVWRSGDGECEAHCTEAARHAQSAGGVCV